MLNKKGGFNIIQLLIVLAIVAAIASFAIPSLHQFQTNAQIDTVATEIGQNLRRAQTKAMSQLNDVSWGVYFADEYYTIFAGSEYATRNSDWDEIYLISNSIEVAITFGQEIIFGKGNGLPNVSGLISLSNSSNDLININVSNLGVISY